MKARTSEFKNALVGLKETKTKITYGSVELGDEQLNSIQPHYEGGILTSVMKQLDLDSNVEIPKDTIFNLQFGVKVREASGNDDGYDYINYGNYIVKESEKQEDTNSYLIKCYDKMLYSMKDYEAFATYPITIRDYINALCTQIGLTFKNANDYFTNYDKTIEKELYLDDSGNSLNYTYRDVLDELAQVTASTICINENDDELEIRYITNAGETTTNTSGTNLSITSEDSKVNEIELLGNTTQNTTTGKNKIKNISTQTLNSVTLTNNGDGSYTLSGTASAWTEFRITLDNELTSGAYTLYASYNKKVAGCYVAIRKSDTSSLGNIELNDNNLYSIKNITTTSNIGIIGITTTAGTNTNGIVIKPMLVSGTYTSSTILPFEPYTGTQPSPNPDYPQEVVNVTGRQEVKCVGKNLLNATSGSHTEVNLTITKNNDGSYTLNGTNGNSTYWYRLANDFTLNAGTYTLSNGNSNVDYNNGAIFYDDNGYFYPIGETITHTFTQNGAIIKPYIRVAANATFNNFTIYPMIEKSSTATTYEPYKEEINEINLGKNLFDKDNATILNAYFGTDTLTSDVGNKTTYIKCSPNTTYTISKTASKRFAVAYTKVVPAINTTIYGKVNGYDLPSITITTGSDALYLVVWLINSNLTGEITLDEAKNTLQIEKGNQATSYSKYFTPIELCKIGTYEDKIFKTTGRNLFDKDDNTMILNSVYVNTSTGKIQSASNSTCVYIECKSNTTYTISKTAGTRFVVGSTNETPTLNLILNKYTSNANASSITFKTGANDTYLVAWVWSGGTDTTITSSQMLDSIMIEKSSSATEYEPYGSGEWYKKAVIGKVILDGSENWQYVSQSHSVFYLNITESYLSSDFTPLSNYFKGTTKSTGASSFAQKGNNLISFLQYASIKRIMITDDDYSVATDFKTWLSTHNTIVYYILATPTYEKLNDTLQEELNSIRLLEGLNNITTNVPIDLTYVSEIDTIDEEYFNEDNVNFGEMYGPVNTIILSRSAESDEIAQSIPSNLSDDEKVAIKIKENQIMNFDNRDEFLYGILTRLYGLGYTQNDYSSKGICYYNVCDRYKANIFGKDYYCVMLNDDVTIESGLSENVFTELPETAETDYSKTSTSDRIERQTTLIVDKQAGIITARVVGIEEEIDGENTYQLTQDERYLAGKTYYILQNSQYVVYTNYSVGDVITGDIYEVVNNGILGRIQATEIKQTNQALEISAIDDRFNDDGSVRALSTTNYTFDSNGLKIGKSTDDYNSLQDNTGTYYYEKDTMIGKYTKDGSVQKDLALYGKYYYGIDEESDFDVKTFERSNALFLAQLYTNGDNKHGFGHFWNGE